MPASRQRNIKIIILELCEEKALKVMERSATR